MSLDPSRTKFEHTRERPLAAGVSAFFDGMALVSDTSGTEEKAALANSNTAGFLGFALIQAVNVTSLPVVESIVVPDQADPGTPTTLEITLGHQNVDLDSLKVYDGSSPVLADAAPAAGNSKLATTPGSSTVTLGGSLAGKTLTAWYSYSPSVNEVMAKFHQAALNYDNQNAIYEQVSVGGGAGSEVFTDFWDPTQGRFTLGGDVFLGPNGKLVAAAITGSQKIGTVIKVPLTNDNYLGLRITVTTGL